MKRTLVKLAVLIAVAVGVYLFITEDNSARILAEILKSADRMELTPDQREDSTYMPPRSIQPLQAAARRRP